MAPKQILDRLEPGERLSWWDQPRQGFMLRAADWFSIPIALFWCGISLFALIKANRSGTWADLIPPSLLLIGLYMLIGRFFHDAWRRARTFYGLTDRRVLIVRGKQFQSLSLDQIEELSLNESKDGTGSIRFGREPPYFTEDGVSLLGPVVPMLERINEAPRVFAAIREAQNKSPAEARH